MATYVISNEETNFARLTTALLQICADLLRETFLQHIPNRDVPVAIAAKESTLKPLLNVEQKKFLFPKAPAKFSGTIKDFDISLLYIVIRNASTVQAHGKGWGKPPMDQPKDISIGANVERVRLLRNKISGHSVSGKVSEADFENFWAEIEECVQELETSLNAGSFVQPLNMLKIQDIDPVYAMRSMQAFTDNLSGIEIKQDNLQTQQKRLFSKQEELQTRQKHIQMQQKAQARQLTVLKQESKRTRLPPFFCLCLRSAELSDFNLRNAQRSLVSLYKKDYTFIPRNPFDPKSAVAIELVYTELEIEEFCTGDNEVVIRHRTDNFESLLHMSSDKNKIKRIYIEGKAGAGKTVYACRLVTDWCTSRLDNGGYLSDFDICLPIALHSLKCHTTLTSLIQGILGNYTAVDADQLTDFIVKNQQRVLIVMDGLDEYRDNCPIINDLIRNNVLQDCVVVTTSRPWKLQDFLTDRLVDRRVRILGFNDYNTKTYAEKVFRHIFSSSKENSVRKAEDLMIKIQANKLAELSKLPLILLFMCCLWQYRNQLPRSETEIYMNVVKCLIGNYKSKRNFVKNSRSIPNLKSIDLDNKRELFLTLGEIAFGGLSVENTASELVFEENYLKKHFNARHVLKAFRIGILSEQKTFSLVSTTSFLSFPHRSIQEFFTAYLFAHSENESLKEQLQSKLQSIETMENFENILKFVVGISQTGSRSKLILQTIAKNYLSVDQNASNNVQERQRTLFTKILQEATTGVGLFLSNKLLRIKAENIIECSEMTMTALDWNFLFMLLSYAQTLEKISIIRCSCIGNCQIKLPPLPALTTFKLDGFTMCPQAWGDLITSFSNAPKLGTLDFDTCNDMHGSLVQIPSLHALQTFKLENITLTSSDWESFFTSWKNISSSEAIIFIRKCPGMQDFQVKLGDLRACDQRLVLKYIEMPPLAWKTLFLSLNENEDIEELHMSDCGTLTESNIQLPSMPALKSFHLRALKMNPADWMLLFASLLNGPQLEVINLASNADLCKSQVQVPPLTCLHHIEFCAVHMLANDWRVLFVSFANAPTLETINVVRCSGMCDSNIEIPRLNNLTTLDIYGVTMLPEDWRMLVSSLVKSTQIQTVTLSWCVGLKGSKIKLPVMPNLTSLHMERSELSLEDKEGLKKSTCNAQKLKCIHY